MRRLLKTLRVMPYAVHRPHFIEPHLARTQQLLQDGDFASADAVLASLPAETYESLVWRICRDRRAPHWLTTWSAQQPSSTHPPLIEAYMDVWGAWVVRGETYANAISFLRRRRYPKIMAQAYEKFVRIVEHDPDNAMALAGLIHCDVVIGIGEGQRDAWLNRLLEAGHFHGPAIHQYARGTLPRWGGSHDEHVQFAGWIVEHAPAGSCSHVVAAQAILDDAFTTSEEITDIRKIAGHLADDAVAAWLRRALLKWADATPVTLAARIGEIGTRSDDAYDGVCLETFALAAYFAGANEESRLLFKALRGRLQIDDWENFIPPMPMWLYAITSKRRGARRVHDRVCRALGLDPRDVCM
ncbi:hypothetical protein [Stenotrophomonas sp. AS1]|uniref:hypothetical protein n=1 Tax=Stenotrophomonas sp. AS1 TaxID=3029188 RepID=UPI001310983F